MKLKHAIASYLLDCGGLDPDTIHVYTLALRRLDRYLKSRQVRKVSAITADHIRVFLKRLAAGKFRARGKGPISDNTLHQHFRSIRTFFRWLVREGKLKRSPMQNVRAPCQPHPATHYLTPGAIADLIHACHHTQHPIRDLTIVMLFLDTGLRRNELARLMPADVNLTEKLVTVQLGKMHKGRAVPLSERCVEALEFWLVARPAELPTLFGLGGTNIYHIFYRMRQRTPALGHVSPHELRHTFGTYYDGDLKDVSLLLGHADVSLTASTYCHRQAMQLRELHDERTPLRLLP